MGKLSSSQKWIASLVSAFVFFVIASPMMYKFVNSITSKIGFSTASEDGLPNVGGLLLHSLVFLLIIRGLMCIPMDHKNGGIKLEV